MSRPVKRSVSIAIVDPDRPGALLLVQRPDDDDDLPGVWGLPASSLLTGESWLDAVDRTGRQKLGVRLAAGAALCEGALERPQYRLVMRLFQARVRTGRPAVPQDAAGITQYQAWRWGAVADLLPAATLGSLCSQLCLRAAGLAGDDRSTCSILFQRLDFGTADGLHISGDDP